MDDWESENVQLSDDKPVVDQWADEDAEEPEVDSWDQDDTPKQPTKSAEPPKPKALTKNQIKQAEQKAVMEASRKARAMEDDPDAQLDEKKKREAAVLGASNKLTQELFSGFARDENDTEPTTRAAPSADDQSLMSADIQEEDKREAAKTKKDNLEEFVLKTDSDYDRFATAVGKKVNADGHSKRILRFLTAICKSGCDAMKIDEVSELKRIATALYNKKATQSKNQKKKPAVNVSASDFDGYDATADDGDDDDAFM